MPQGVPHSNHVATPSPAGVQPIRVWEAQYPDTWLLLEITAEDAGEPLAGIVLATATTPVELQEAWRSARAQGILTMVTYGRPRTPGPEVIVSAT